MLLCPEINSDPSQMLNWINSFGINKATILCASV